MNIFKYFILSVGITNAFFAPSIKTSSGQKLNIVGQGPPFLFSPGLFGTMPTAFYSEFINYLKKNITIVSIDGFNPIYENTIHEVCDALNVDKIGYIGHSSFFPEVLDNPNIEKAVLMDPINLPWVNFDGFSNSVINLDYPVYIIKSGKLYEEDISNEIFFRYLKAPISELDLLIRTGGDHRISNFLLYHLAYTEIQFTNTLWPDFTEEEFIKCLEAFSNTERRFGKRTL